MSTAATLKAMATPPQHLHEPNLNRKTLNTLVGSASLFCYRGRLTLQQVAQNLRPQRAIRQQRRPPRPQLFLRHRRPNQQQPRRPPVSSTYSYSFSYRRPSPLRFPIAFAPFGTAGFVLTPEQEAEKKIRDRRRTLRQRQQRGHAPSRR